MKKIGIVVATIILSVFLVAVGFFGGQLLTPDGYFGDTEITDTTVLEILELLETDHYKQPETEELYKGLIDGAIDALDDPYTTYFDYDEYAQYLDTYTESYVGIGVTISARDEYLVVEEVNLNGPADTAGMLPNDLIITVDSVSIAGMNFYDVRDMIVGDEGTTVTIEIIREGYDDPIPLEITRALIESPTVVYERVEKEGSYYGYIKVTTFGDETAEKFHDAIEDLEKQGIDGMVIDLRNNGGGHLGTVLSMLREFLVDDDTPMFYTDYYSDGVLNEDEYYATRDEKKTYDIVTLINGNSASASEVFASSMQEHGGYTLVGETSFGKGTMQQDRYVESTCTEGSLGTLDCSSADRVHISIGRWYTSDKNWVHFDGGTDGITPDIIVEPSEQEKLFKIFLLNGETIEFDTVDSRLEIIQQILNIMGYDVRTDGYFDNDTLLAIKDIQSNNGLTNDGIINDEVMAILNAELDTYKGILWNDQQFLEAIEYLHD